VRLGGVSHSFAYETRLRKTSTRTKYESTTIMLVIMLVIETLLSKNSLGAPGCTVALKIGSGLQRKEQFAMTLCVPHKQ